MKTLLFIFSCLIYKFSFLISKTDYYYNDINLDCEVRNKAYNHKFQCIINDILTVNYSLFELIQSLQCLNLSTINAVWQKIPKNEDELIGNKQNLCLCVHILICVCIQNKYAKNKDSPNNNSKDYNKFQTDANYLKFLDDITQALCQYFVSRIIRTKLSPNCLSLRDNKSNSNIVMGFGDLVENTPQWLLAINTMHISFVFGNGTVSVSNVGVLSANVSWIGFVHECKGSMVGIGDSDCDCDSVRSVSVVINIVSVIIFVIVAILVLCNDGLSMSDGLIRFRPR